MAISRKVTEHISTVGEWCLGRDQLFRQVQNGAARELYSQAVADIAIKALGEVFFQLQETLVRFVKEEEA